MIASAERRGSSDAEICSLETADLAGFVATLPCLVAIGFNGATAARHGRRHLRGSAAADSLALIDLPSSSPAHAALTLAQKRAVWAPLARFLGAEPGATRDERLPCAVTLPSKLLPQPPPDCRFAGLMTSRTQARRNRSRLPRDGDRP